jgi:hypothetical protein
LFTYAPQALVQRPAAAAGPGALAVNAETGTSSMPRASSPALQRAMRSRLEGRAVATPIAAPRARASASSRVSAASIAVGVDDRVGGGRGQAERRRDRAGEAARRRAVVDIEQAARGDLAERRGQRARVGGELAAKMIDDAGVADEPPHLPAQRIEVVGVGSAGQQRVRAGIVGGIGEGLHRRLQQDLVAGFARRRRFALEVVAVGGEAERDGRRQPRDRVGGAGGVEAEAADQERHPRRVGPELGGGEDRPRVDLGGARAVGADARQQAEARFLDEPPVGGGG